MISLDEPPGLVIQSFKTWMDGVKPVAEPESHFLDDPEDVVSLSQEHRQKELLDHFLERYFYQYFVTKTVNSPGQSPGSVEYYSSKAIQKVARVILCFAAVLFAVIPFPILAQFTSASATTTIIAGFSAAFGSMIALVTHSRTAELFIAMAAYGAFLVAFVRTTDSN